MKKLFLSLCFGLVTLSAFSQNKTIVGIMPFDKPKVQKNYYEGTDTKNKEEYIVAIQDAVSDSFLKAKRFTLVEREKMAQIRGEKKTQQTDEFIDGQTVEHSKSLGASYIVTGNVQEASFEESSTKIGIVVNFSIPSRKAKISFNLKVIDVATGEIVASEKFSAVGSGKSAYDEALQMIKPEIEKFIKANFKVSISVASIEAKGASNEATKVLISAGTSLDLKAQTVLKVYELTSLMIDGKKIPRKKEIGKISVEKVEDENFSLCNVILGGDQIAVKLEAGANLKCEIITE